MLVELRPRADELLRFLMARHPHKSAKQILEEALAAYFQRELGQPVTVPLIAAEPELRP
jgi:hypothetical protein